MFHVGHIRYLMHFYRNGSNNIWKYSLETFLYSSVSSQHLLKQMLPLLIYENFSNVWKWHLKSEIYYAMSYHWLEDITMFVTVRLTKVSRNDISFLLWNLGYHCVCILHFSFHLSRSIFHIYIYFSYVFWE